MQYQNKISFRSSAKVQVMEFMYAELNIIYSLIFSNNNLILQQYYIYRVTHALSTKLITIKNVSLLKLRQ